MSNRFYGIWILSLSIIACLAAPHANAEERFEKEIANFIQQDAKNPTQKWDTIFVGSSSIRRWDLEKSFPDEPFLNRGFGGSKYSDAVKHLDALVLKHAPRQVVVFSGTNDIHAGRTPEKVFQDFKAFESNLRAKLPESKLIVLSITTSPSRFAEFEKVKKANKLIRALCEQTNNTVYVDVVSSMLDSNGAPRAELYVKDNLHLSKKGYAIWKSKLADHLGSKDKE